MGFAPDKEDPYPKPKDTGNGGKTDDKGKKKTTLKFNFMPGQIGDIATDMSTGYGGSMDKWKGYLNDVYSPVKVHSFNFGGNGGGNGGGNNNVNGGGNNGGGPGRPDPGKPDPYVGDPVIDPRRGVAAGQGFLNVGPMGQQIPPTLGLLNNPQQQKMAAPGQLPPEIMAMLMRR